MTTHEPVFSASLGIASVQALVPKPGMLLAPPPAIAIGMGGALVPMPPHLALALAETIGAAVKVLEAYESERGRQDTVRPEPEPEK
jgi:hypothetical protein